MIKVALVATVGTEGERRCGKLSWSGQGKHNLQTASVSDGLRFSLQSSSGHPDPSQQDQQEEPAQTRTLRAVLRRRHSAIPHLTVILCANQVRYELQYN